MDNQFSQDKQNSNIQFTALEQIKNQSQDSPIRGLPKLVLVIVIIFIITVILGIGVYTLGIYKNFSVNTSTKSSTSPSEQMKVWATYNDPHFSIKYPPDVMVGQRLEGAVVSFVPKNSSNQTNKAPYFYYISIGFEESQFYGLSNGGTVNPFTINSYSGLRAHVSKNTLVDDNVLLSRTDGYRHIFFQLENSNNFPSQEKNFDLMLSTYKENHVDYFKIYDAQIKDDFKQIQAALASYYNDYQHYPTTINELFPKYLTKLPVNPYDANTAYQYQSSNNNYTLQTSTENGIYKVTSL